MKQSETLKASLMAFVVIAIVMLARRGGDEQSVKDGRPESGLPNACGAPAAASTSVSRQMPTARGTHPFEVALAEGVRPRELNGLASRAGARIVSYLPRGGAIVEATDAVAAKLRAMREIATVDECEPASKFAPGFRERLAQASSDEAMRVSFSLLNAADAGTLSQQIAAAGGSVLCGTDPKSAFQWLSTELPAVPMRTYAIRANMSLTNRTGWVTLPGDVTSEQLKAYNFFKVDVNLRQ